MKHNADQGAPRPVRRDTFRDIEQGRSEGHDGVLEMDGTVDRGAESLEEVWRTGRDDEGRARK